MALSKDGSRELLSVTYSDGQDYSLCMKPDPCSPIIRTYREELYRAGLHPTELVELIASGVPCLKISISGFAAAGEWKTQHALYRLGLDMDKLLGDIQHCMLQMKLTCEGLLKDMVGGFVYAIEGHTELAVKRLKKAKTEAGTFDTILQPLVEKTEAMIERFKAKELAVWNSRNIKYMADTENAEPELEKSEKEKKTKDGEEEELDRKKREKEGKLLICRLFQNTSIELKNIEKEREDLRAEKKKIDEHIAELKEKKERRDFGWNGVHYAMKAMKQILAYFLRQQLWWGKLSKILEKKLQPITDHELDAQNLGDIINASAFKIEMMEAYFWLTSVAGLADLSVGYLHRSMTTFGRTLAEHPTREQAQKDIETLVASYEAAVSGRIKKEIDGAIEEQNREYDERIKLTRTSPYDPNPIGEPQQIDGSAPKQQQIPILAIAVGFFAVLVFLYRLYAGLFQHVLRV